MLNHHHVELFYYVARAGGISAVARAMPYGIQAPAISMQLTELEDELGTALFARKPFRLTPAGEEFYAFCRRYFERVDAVSARLPRTAAPLLRIATPDIVVREYLPEGLAALQRGQPNLRFSFSTGTLPQIETWVREGEIDAGFTLVDQPPSGVQWKSLRTLRLVLLVPAGTPARSADYFWKQKIVREPLICPSQDHAVGRAFHKGLARVDAWWRPAIAVNSTAVVLWLVTRGSGVGVSVDVPRLARHPGVRVLPLRDFDPVTVAALWNENVAPLHPQVRELLPRIATHKVWRARSAHGAGEGCAVNGALAVKVEG